MRLRCARCNRFTSSSYGLGEAHLCARHQAERQRGSASEVDAATRAVVAVLAAKSAGVKATVAGVRRISGAPEYVVRRVMRENGA